MEQVFVIDIFKFVILIFSLSFHECAHAWMASRLGDQTARMQGRVTLNPLDHIDPIGTVLFPAIVIFGPLINFTLFSGFLIGWAKPTPITTRNFRKIVRDDNLTTLAGPASNLILVFVAFAVLAVMEHVLPDGYMVVQLSFLSAFLPPSSEFTPQPLALICSLAILVNLSLFFFNLLPIPPLDGSRVVRNILPYNAVQQYDRINGWMSWLLMIVFGGIILRMLMTPALSITLWGLVHI